MCASPNGRKWTAWAGAALALAVALAPLSADAGEDGVQTSLVGGSELDHALGHALFEFTWVSAPASTKSTEGLGPLYNARSCATCHTVTARRTPVDAAGRAVSSAIVFKFTGSAAPDPTY